MVYPLLYPLLNLYLYSYSHMVEENLHLFPGFQVDCISGYYIICRRLKDPTLSPELL